MTSDACCFVFVAILSFVETVGKIKTKREEEEEEEDDGNELSSNEHHTQTLMDVWSHQWHEQIHTFFNEDEEVKKTHHYVICIPSLNQSTKPTSRNREKSVLVIELYQDNQHCVTSKIKQLRRCEEQSTSLFDSISHFISFHFEQNTAVLIKSWSFDVRCLGSTTIDGRGAEEKEPDLWIEEVVRVRFSMIAVVSERHRSLSVAEWMIILYYIHLIAASLTLGWWLPIVVLLFKEGVRRKTRKWKHLAPLWFLFDKFFFSLSSPLSLRFTTKTQADRLSLIWQWLVWIFLGVEVFVHIVALCFSRSKDWDCCSS